MKDKKIKRLEIILGIISDQLAGIHTTLIHVYPDIKSEKYWEALEELQDNISRKINQLKKT